MDAAFVPCTHSSSYCLQPPVLIRLCVQSPLPGQLKCVYAAGTWKKIVLKIVGLLLLFAILCGAFFRQRFANFALPSFFFVFCILALVAQIFFLVFCFGPTPFGKLMRKFLVKCEISRYFSKHTHSHTQEASECACVLGVCVCVWWFFVCLQVGDYCTLFVWRCLSTKLLVHLSMPLDWWLLCALVQRPAPHPLPHSPQPAPFPPQWVACNLTQTTRWSSPWAAHQCQHSAHSFYFTYQISWQKRYKKVLAACHFLGGCFAWCSGLD